MRDSLINDSGQLTILSVILDSKITSLIVGKMYHLWHQKKKKKIRIICKAFMFQDKNVNVSATDSNLNLLSKIVWSAHFLFPSCGNYDLDYRRNTSSLLASRNFLQ